MFLAPGNHESPLADFSLVSLWQTGDGSIDLRFFGDGTDLFVCSVDSAVANIVLNCVVKEWRVLWDYTDIFAKRGEGDSPDILAVDEDLAGLDVEEAVY